PWRCLCPAVLSVLSVSALSLLSLCPEPVLCELCVPVSPVNLVLLSTLTSSTAYASSFSTGILTTNRVPLPSRTGLSHAIVPPSSSTRLSTIASPSPVPLAFVVKYGSNILVRNSGVIPGPSSSTRISNPASPLETPTRTRPPFGCASIAFTIKFESTSFSASSDASTSISRAGPSNSSRKFRRSASRPKSDAVWRTSATAATRCPFTDG